MALNKTPSAQSGFFSEMTASAGRNFLVPVRIKVTPNNSMRPLSDGKKNNANLFKPVLVKDLFQSTQKDKKNTTLASVSTQKKKSRREGQPYLNTQSCYKPKQNEAGNSTFFGRKSCESKVRRQLYQTLDSPQKLLLESKDSNNKTTKPTRLTINKNLDKNRKTTQADTSFRKSYLLPPNSIKNTYLRNSEFNFKPPGKKTVVKNSTVNVNFIAKNASQVVEPKKQNQIRRNNTKTNNSKNTNFIPDYTDDMRQSPIMCDNFTMTSPFCYQKTPSSKTVSNINTFERPSVIISPSKVNPVSNNFNNIGPICNEMQGLNINKTVCCCSQGIQEPQTNYRNMLDFSNVNVSDCGSLMQIKSFLEHSVQARENEILQLKQAIDCINTIINSKIMVDVTTETSVKPEVQDNFEENKEVSEKCNNLSCRITVYEDKSNTSDKSQDSTIDISKSIEKFDIYHDDSTISIDLNKTKPEEKPVTQAKNQSLTPIKILLNGTNLIQESSASSLEMLNEAARLSTIGEVSCEISGEIQELNKDEKSDTENKENKNSSNKIKRSSFGTPRTPKTPRRRTIAVPSENYDSGNRRRSSRLAKKRLSQSSCLSDSEKQDSFTMLENELNVVHDAPLKSSKSLPASPMKAPLTPGTIKQWDKRVERPLKEYMALKMNGSLLVTPDVTKFQSRLEPTDTPHSRKSLSRKIFMELCDLYAESPEQN